MTQCTQAELWLAAREADSLSPQDDEALRSHLGRCPVCRELAGFADSEGFGRLEVVPDSRYRIGAELARGGMGRIRAAEDLRLGREVAIKELLEEGEGVALELRFEREAMITARLQHPAIVPIYEAGRWPSGEPFYAMKRVRGRSLDDVAGKAQSTAERIALVPHVLAIAEAIAFAHDRGIIHRDLKPHNVLIGDYGETVVIDWGLAKDLNAAPDEANVGPYRSGDVQLTHVGAVVGTPAYMPPEQARGEEVDTRADVYALGAILYRVLSGRLPYEGDDALADLIAGPPGALSAIAPDVPPDLVAIVEKAMARTQEDRYETAAELAADLQRYTTGKLVAAHDYSMGQLLRRWLARHRGMAITGATLLVALVATAAFSVRRIVSERNAAEAAREEAIAQENLAVREQASLLLEQGRQHMLADRPDEAAVYLSAAYSMGQSGAGLRYLLGKALRSVEARRDRLPDARLGGRELRRFSPDGALVAAPTDSGDVRVWETSSGQLLHTLAVGDKKDVLAWSGDSKRLAVGVKPVTVWDMATGARILELDMHWASWGMNRDGTRLFATVMEFTWVWDADSGAELYHGPSRAPANSWIHPVGDETQVIAAGADGIIRFLNAQTMEVEGSIGSTDNPVFIPPGTEAHAIIDDGGRLLVISPVEHRASIWSPGRDQPDVVFQSTGSAELLAAHFNGDQTLVATSSATEAVRVWNAKTGELHHAIPYQGGPLLADFVRDDGERERLLVSSPVRGTSTTYDPLSGVPVATYNGVARPNRGGGRFLLADDFGVHLVAAGADPLRSAELVPTEAGPFRWPGGNIVAREDRRALVWDGRTGERVETLRLFDDGGGWQASISADGARIVDKAADGALRVRAVGTGKPDDRPEILATLRDPGTVLVAGLSQNGDAVVLIHPERRISVWDVASEKRVASWQADPDLLVSLPKVTGGAERIVTTSSDGSVHLWTRDGNSVARIAPGPDAKLTVARLLPHGDSVLVYRGPEFAANAPNFDEPWHISLWKTADGSSLGDLASGFVFPHLLWGETDPAGRHWLYQGQLWDTRTGSPIDVPELEGGGVGVGSFSDDGRRLAVPGGFGGPGGARVVDLADGSISCRGGQSHGSALHALLSPDGKLLALSSLDGSTTLWDVDTCTEIATVPTTKAVWKVDSIFDQDGGASVEMALPCFGDTGQFLLTLTPPTIAHVWDVALEERSPDQVQELVGKAVPLHIESGRLVPTEPAP